MDGKNGSQRHVDSPVVDGHSDGAFSVDGISPVTATRAATNDASLLQLVSGQVKGFVRPEFSSLNAQGATVHPGRFGEIYSRLNINIHANAQPVVELVWKVNRRYRRRGYRLLGFRNAGEYGSTSYSHRHQIYGTLIVSTDLGSGRATPEHKDYVQEGRHFYTFFVVKMGLFGLWHRYAGPIQFAETVPSLDWVKQQVTKQHEVNGMLRKETRDALQHQIETEKLRNQQAEIRKIAPTSSEEDPKTRLMNARLKRHSIRAFAEELLQAELQTLRSLPRYKAASATDRQRMEDDLLLDWNTTEDELKP